MDGHAAQLPSRAEQPPEQGKQRASLSVAGHLDKTPRAPQGAEMGFGPFRVKAKFGETNILSSTAAMAFVRSLEPSYRTSYHWKVAERMIHFAWMSVEDEALAEKAFKIALETDNWLIS